MVRGIVVGALALWIGCAWPAAAWPELRIEALVKDLARAIPGDTYKFAVVGDSRGGHHILAAQLRAMHEAGARFAFHGGDLIGESSKSQFQAARHVLGGAPLPVLMVMGNHERAREGPFRFYETFGQPNYSLDIGRVRFVVVDNSEGLVSTAQLQWLDKQLDTPRRKVVLAHIPPRLPKWEYAFYYNAAKFNAMLEARRVDYAVFSHVHMYDHQARRGVRYVITGGGGAPLYSFIRTAARDGGHFHHFLLFEVRGDQIAYRVVRSPQPDSHSRVEK